MEAGSSTAAARHNAAPAPPGDMAIPDPLHRPHSSEQDEQERRPKTVERAGWEDAIALMARSATVLPELSTDSSLRSYTSTASMKVKNVKKLPLSKGHFPRLAECAHFHYENVDFGSVQLTLTCDENDLTHSSLNSRELVYLVQICCQGKKWIVRRSYEDFRVLDKHLHLCIYDRRFSRLTELPRFENLKVKSEPLSQMLTAYLSRLSTIADNKINCGPALTWMEIDNKGNRLLVHDESSINVPAVAAAHVIKRYIAQAADELSFEVGDIVSVIDMPPKEDTGWWRGKHGFKVGFFPCECVELISEKVPPSVTGSLPKPVSNKHGKLITFLRTFMKSRPTKQKLKQRGILKERVFGCDLGEHLLNSGHDVPQVIKSCTEFIEKHGVVDGIYRLSGISSNIQKLRHEFDSEHIPDLSKDTYIQDIHSVGSLCKLYFRELPNPLLTYQLYDKFSEAVSGATDDERLVKIHDVIQQLPPPHYRTLEFLMRHLAHMATFSYVTNMHCKNLAIVWAPNLLRSKQIESACFSGTSAFMEVRIQSVVVEFILNHVDVLFSPKLSTLIRESSGHGTLSRPKSLLVCSPSTKLLSLEEAQARTQAQLTSPVSPESKYIEVGEGPGALQGKFHTIIEFPMERKKAQTKVKKSPVASWRSFFNMAKSSTTAKRKLLRHPSEPNNMKTSQALSGGRGDTGTLRSSKSEESLSSTNLEGAVTFDCTPGLVRSVSLITSQPAVKSAARMLALALAESAQQATCLRKRGSSEPPTPVSPSHLQDPLSILQWPPKPSQQAQTSSASRGHCCGTCKTVGKPSSVISTGSYTDAGSLQSTCACHGSESGHSYSDGGDVSAESHKTNLPPEDLPAVKNVDTEQDAESHMPLRENVRHVGVGTDGGSPEQSSEMESYKNLMPSPSQTVTSLSTTNSQTARASLLNKQAANASNFRVILAEASMPASVHDVLPQSPVSPLNSAYECSPKDEMLRPSGQTYWSGPFEQANSFQPDYQAKIFSKDHYNTLAPRSLHQSIKYKSQQRNEHSPSFLYRHGGPRYPPMDGASVYPTIRRVRSMHAPPEDTFFFPHPSYQKNTYHRQVLSDIHQVRPYFEDGKVQYRYKPYSGAQYNNLDQYRVSSHGYGHSYTLLRRPTYPGRVMSKAENYPNMPYSREASFIKQGTGHFPRARNVGVYEGFDAGLSGQHFSPSFRQGNIEKRRMQDVVPQPHLQKESQRGQETMRTGNKSDSTKDLLISTEGADGKYRVTMVSHYSPEHPHSESNIPLSTQMEKQRSGHSAKPALMLKQSRSMQNYMQKTLEALPQPRKLTLQKEYSCPDFKHTDSSEHSSARLHSQDKLIRVHGSHPKADFQYAWVKGHDLQRSARSQSMKSHRQPRHTKMTLEHDHRFSYPVQSRPRTRSMFAPSRTDYMDGYVSLQTKVHGIFPNYGCMPPHSNRLYSSAMGTGRFLHSEIRPETEIYAE
ncbi:rho GTPase-activating protein 32 isoform X4 [Neoarius graeffei]|uniref:rho GTPase-activating protein 32 isoform X4 n=1 Tax=Neoarius graeffei TaxID=443677 RepID=UPI00298C2748|nr:rho GTPase-activating protein 32 isoform X4 [Neoarius graeffei]